MMIGILISIPGLFATAGGLGHIRVSRFLSEMKTNLFFFIMMGIGIFILSIAPDIKTLVIGLVITGIAFGVINATNLSWLGRIAPESSRGRIFSGFTTVLFLGKLVCPIDTEEWYTLRRLRFPWNCRNCTGNGVRCGRVWGIVEEPVILAEHPAGIISNE